MPVIANILVGKETISMEAACTIEDAMRSIDMLPDTFLFIVDGKPVPMDTYLLDGMTVKAVKVASGG